MEGTPVIIKKKKSHGDHAHHGGSWKVAYADFVTAMMAFFMVMWIMGLSESTRSIIQGYFNDPLGFEKNMPRTKNIINFQGTFSRTAGQADGRGSNVVRNDQNELEGVKKKIEQAVEQMKQQESGQSEAMKVLNNVTMQMTDEGLRIEFTEATGAVFFETGSAVIRPIAQQLVRRIEPLLARSRRMIVVEGHTDAQPYANPNYNNVDLSLDRARSMEHLLWKDGIPITQFDGATGYGATRLKDPDHPYSFVNRRVTLLLPFDRRAVGDIPLPKAALQDEVQGIFRDDLRLGPKDVDLRSGDSPGPRR